jgi:hypothetical protein
VTGTPAVSSRRENQIDVFVLGSDNAMLHRSWDGSRWTDWENHGGVGGPRELAAV